MSVPTLILGHSGTGKSTSLRNMDPGQTLLIQAVKKPLPFRAKDWGYFDKANNPKGNIIVCDNGARVCELMRRTSRKVICFDDSNYVMSNAFMRRATETGYQKFTEMAQDTFNVFETAANLAEDVRVYIFAHTQQGDDGVTRFKTVGKLLDEKVVLEGLVTICLKTVVSDGQYFFTTRNNGADVVKSPLGMFEQEMIDNDLAEVDKAITAYYNLATA